MSDPLLPVPDPPDFENGDQEPDDVEPGAGASRGEEEFDEVESDPEPDVLPGPGDDEHPPPEERAPAYRTPEPGDRMSTRELEDDLRDERGV